MYSWMIGKHFFSRKNGQAISSSPHLPFRRFIFGGRDPGEKSTRWLSLLLFRWTDENENESDYGDDDDDDDDQAIQLSPVGQTEPAFQVKIWNMKTIKLISFTGAIYGFVGAGPLVHNDERPKPIPTSGTLKKIKVASDYRQPLRTIQSISTPTDPTLTKTTSGITIRTA